MRNSWQCRQLQEFHNLWRSKHLQPQTFLKKHLKEEFLSIISSLLHIFQELIERVDKYSNLNVAYLMIYNGSFLVKYYHCFYICLSIVLFTNLNTEPYCSLWQQVLHLLIGYYRQSAFLSFHYMYFFDDPSVLIIFEETRL